MNELALFAGTGGGILGGKLCGFRTVAAVEIEPYRREILLRRQRDGLLPLFPIWDDIETFDGTAWTGAVDIITGGFPCQDISVAGKGAGIDGERSGLWREYARIIGEVRPRYTLVENSPALTTRGLDRVLGDLAAMGYDANWGVVSAADSIWLAGTPAINHLRERIWIVGHLPDAHEKSEDSYRRVSVDDNSRNSDETMLRTQREISGGQGAEPAGIYSGSDTTEGRSQRGSDAVGINCETGCQPDCEPAGVHPRDNTQPDSLQERPQRIIESGPETRTDNRSGDGDYPAWWATEPELGRVAHGISNRVDRIAAVGDAQVPAVVALAWHLLRP